MNNKKIKVKCLRNVLASPFHLQWSEKREDEIAPVRNALEKLLPVAKLEKKPWVRPSKQNKDVTIKPYFDSNKEPNIYRTYLSPGFQSVIRGLERKELCCVVMSSDITPTSLQKVLFAYASVNNVPTFIIPDLKRITKSTLGFSTMAMGFKNIVCESPENEFHPIYRMIANNSVLVDAPFLVMQKKECFSDQNVNKDSEENLYKIPKIRESERMYLYRETLCDRVFNPENKKSFINKNALKNNKQKLDDFIFLENSTEKSCLINVEKGSVDKGHSKNINDDDDDDDDDTDSHDDIFFVDSNPDKSLLSNKNQSSQYGAIQSTDSLKKWNKKESNKYSSFNNEKTIKTTENHKPKQKNLSTINFRPLLVKSVINNPIKRRKNKKK